MLLIVGGRGLPYSGKAPDAALGEEGMRRYHEREALVRASEGLDDVLVRTVREANTLELVKQSLLVISLEALDELHEMFNNQRLVGHVAPGALIDALAAAEDGGAELEQ